MKFQLFANAVDLNGSYLWSWVYDVFTIFSLKTQQIKVKLVEIDIEFNSLPAYTSFNSVWFQVITDCNKGHDEMKSIKILRGKNKYPFPQKQGKGSNLALNYIIPMF